MVQKRYGTLYCYYYRKQLKKGIYRKNSALTNKPLKKREKREALDKDILRVVLLFLTGERV